MQLISNVFSSMDIVGEGDSIDQTKSTNYRRWTQSMDSLLLEVLKEQKVKGQKQENAQELALCLCQCLCFYGVEI